MFCVIHHTFTHTYTHMDALTPQPPTVSPLQWRFYRPSCTPGVVLDSFSTTAPIWQPDDLNCCSLSPQVWAESEEDRALLILSPSLWRDVWNSRTLKIFPERCRGSKCHFALSVKIITLMRGDLLLHVCSRLLKYKCMSPALQQVCILSLFLHQQTHTDVVVVKHQDHFILSHALG